MLFRIDRFVFIKGLSNYTSWSLVSRIAPVPTLSIEASAEYHISSRKLQFSSLIKELLPVIVLGFFKTITDVSVFHFE